MKVYLDLSYGFRGVVELTPTELDTLTKVLDRVQFAEHWYSRNDELRMADPSKRETYAAVLVPATTRVVPYTSQNPAETA